MEIPDVVSLEFSSDGSQIRYWSRNAPNNHTAMVEYHHNRTVYALRRENEELKVQNEKLLALLNEAEFNPFAEDPQTGLLKALCDDKHSQLKEAKEDNPTYLLKRLKILEAIMDILSETATPNQIELLNRLGREANNLSVKLDEEYSLPRET